MKLSIIVVSWNGCGLLRDCLRSIHNFPPGVQHEVIVVDNGSADRSAEMVEQEFSDARLIRNTQNQGFARGNNQGIAVANGELVLLLGSDTEVRQGSIQSMISFLEGHPEAGAVSCKLVFPDGRLQRSCKRFPTLGNAVAIYCSLHWLNKRYLMDDFDHQSIREVDQPDATCIMIRRALMNALGGFDERFSILYNDVDLCQRMKKLRRSVYFLPTAQVIHHGSQSTRKAPPLLRLEMYRNILLYYYEYSGTVARWILTPILMIRFILVTRSFTSVRLLKPLTSEMGQ